MRSAYEHRSTGEPRGAAHDTGIGLAMLVIFTAAVLIVTGAVAELALVGSWWMLGAVFAAHVAVTALVTATIAHAMSDGTLAMARADGDQARATPRPDRPSPRKPVVAHL